MPSGPSALIRGLALRIAWLAIPLAVAACSPDLREMAGPRVPTPNVSGLVMRDGIPLPDERIKLADTATDSTIASALTDAEGRFHFSQVPRGDWTIKVRSTDPRDFASVTLQFVLSTAETTLDSMPIEISMRGMVVKNPENGATVPLPGFVTPLTFDWELPALGSNRVQVRLYDSSGQAIWFSEKLRTTSVLWNGIANQGSFTGRPITPGDFTWRMRVETDNTTLEGSTTFRRLTLQGT